MVGAMDRGLHLGDNTKADRRCNCKLGIMNYVKANTKYRLISASLISRPLLLINSLTYALQIIL